MVGLGEEDFASLSPELIQKYTEQFKTPERFMQINGNIVVLPVPAEKQDLAYLPDRFETDDYGMIDGVINNGRRGEELEKAQEYTERTTPEKPSIRERLEDAKRECAEHKPPEGKKPGRDVPEHDCL